MNPPLGEMLIRADQPWLDFVVASCNGLQQYRSKLYMAETYIYWRSVVSNGGYVKGGVRYLIMDNLVVKPMSTVSIVDVLKELNVMEVGVLEQKLVGLGTEEGLKLVKASLESNPVLSNIFLGNELHKLRFNSGA
ncbi:hypothetical protein RchiOBHm_Chr5g0055161 [Rosa chinensis]|uniref:Uncharacterized protein n=1 Tax=Rosa chinensis TaxID=74649 RepID=A0A2P6QGC2_ROSCH|nr:hypothetical protein RchiOBHm_Chr5g0055161 [Rosa chinensis]